MTSIDELFKSRLTSRAKTAANANGTKRKATDAPTPDEAYKAARTSLNGDAKGRSHNQDYAATVEPDEDEDPDDDTEAGPPEDAEQDEADGEDEEGRFFGGGVNAHTATAIDYVDDADGDTAIETIDAPWLRRTALAFEKSISTNAALRAKHEGDPVRFMASEGELDANIQALSILSQYPNLYNDFADLGCASSLVGLLAHENTDIAINAIQILAELTDEDVATEQSQWDALVGATLDADLLDLLIQNLGRLDEAENEADRAGVYHSLSLLENLISQPETLKRAAQSDQATSLLEWLLARIQKPETPTTQNKHSAAELLAVALQSSSAFRAHFLVLDGLDAILQLLAPYRKHDPPKDTEEEELVENLFDALTALSDTNAGKRQFRNAEGAELMLIMLKDGGKLAKPRALRVLDHALAPATTTASAKSNKDEASDDNKKKKSKDGDKDDEASLRTEPAQTCERFVEAAGLKPLFATLMRSPDAAATEHALGMLASLLRQLPASSAARLRTLAKCVEKGYQAVGRLAGLRRELAGRLARADAAMARERAAADEEEREARRDEWLGRRLDAGLSAFQTVDVVLAWLAAEDTGAKTELLRQLGEGGLAEVKATLTEQLDGLADSSDPDELDAADMLRALIDCLD